jgi:AcrR family transcriptional regulator
MISYYFGSKDKLLEALFSFRGETMKVTLESIIDRKDISSLEKIYLMIDNYIAKIMNQQCFSRILAREQVLNNTGPTATLILEMKKRSLELIQRIIKEGQKRGEFRKNIDTAMMMTTMIGTAHNLITTKHYYKELNNLQEVSDEEFEKLIGKKLANHLKFLFKAMLTYED